MSGDSDSHGEKHYLDTAEEETAKKKILDGDIMVLPTDTGNTATYGLINNLKHRMDTEIKSISQSLHVQLTERVKRLEDIFGTMMSAQATLPNHEEQLVKLQEDNAAQAKVIANLKERLCKIEAKQQSAGDGTVDLSAFKQRIDDLVNTLVLTIPEIDMDDTIKPSTVQMRRNTRERSKYKLHPLSDYREFSSSRTSSTTSSGYKSAESQMGLTSIREQDSNLNPTSATPNIVYSTPLTDDREDSIDYLTDPHALKCTVVDTLWSMGDLLDVLSSLMHSINKEGVSQQDLRESTLNPEDAVQVVIMEKNARRMIKPETSDFTTQFDSTVSMCDLTHNGVIAGEHIFLIVGESPRYYEWEECGLAVHVPGNGLSPLSTCEMRVSALVGGDFTIPDGHEVVSGIYAVTFSQPLQRNTVLDVQHCVDLQTPEDINMLSFAVASPLPYPGSYLFTSIKGGRFSIKDRYGSIEASESMCYCIMMREYTHGEKQHNIFSNITHSSSADNGQEGCNPTKNKENSDGSAEGAEGGEKNETHSSKTNNGQEDCNQSGHEEDSDSCGGSGELTGGNEGSESSTSGNDDQPDSEGSNETNEEADEEEAKAQSQQEFNDLSMKSKIVPKTEQKTGEKACEEQGQQKPKSEDAHDLVVKPENVPEAFSSHQRVKQWYLCQTLVVKNHQRRWDAEVVFTKELNILKTYVASRTQRERDKQGIIYFRFNKEHLTIEIPQDCKSARGWRVVPDLDHPYKIPRKLIDFIGKGTSSQPVSSTYTAFREVKSEEVFIFSLTVNHVEEDRLKLNIKFDSTQESDFCIEKENTSDRSKDDQTDSSGTSFSILDKKPLLKDVFNQLRELSLQWDDIGLQLDIPFDLRDGWHKDNSLTNRQRLERVINKWLEGECLTPVTWSELIVLLRDSLSFSATARNIEKFIQSKRVQETYKHRV